MEEFGVTGVSNDQQKSLWLADRQMNYHQRQFSHPYKSTIHLRQFVKNIINNHNDQMAALDVGCGAGANIFHLSQCLKKTSWVGIDINEKLFSLGHELISEHGGISQPFQFITGDFYNLTEILPKHSFDLVFAIQILSWLPEYEMLLRQLFKMVKHGGIIFLTSLFTEFWVDLLIKVTQYDAAEFEHPDGPYYYNIYCLDRFKKICLDLGASQIEIQDFEIDIALPKPTNNLMGTYTVTSVTGKFQQYSGPLFLPWKFIAIRTSMG